MAMAKSIPEEDLLAIETAIRRHAPASLQQIEQEVGDRMLRRTLQARLKHLIEKHRVTVAGERRWARYQLSDSGEELVVGGAARIDQQGDLFVPVSPKGGEIQKYVRQPAELRKPVGYDRKFLDGYRPNVTTYLSAAEREHLRKVGTPSIAIQADAGTYAKQILSRLLIELSWNSSRLEGNTYSLLDTRRLIDFGQQAEGKDQLDAQMILNHKDAIEFLVNDAADIGFNRFTILNLHGMLANNLLSDPDAPGRLRQMAVGIGGSVFRPLENPQVIVECFDQVLATAAAIKDPFEQALFATVHLPYLQPFDDVNKRVSRLAANIPLIKHNLCPLSFADVPKQTYIDGVKGVYELRKVDLLKDVFIWAYERSASSYAAVRQSIGEPDPFRLRLRAELRTIVAEVVRAKSGRRAAAKKVAAWTEEHLDEADREKFIEVAEGELLALHEGNFARYGIRESEFAAWQKLWAPTSKVRQT
jgi:hypothetical protein